MNNTVNPEQISLVSVLVASKVRKPTLPEGGDLSEGSAPKTREKELQDEVLRLRREAEKSEVRYAGRGSHRVKYSFSFSSFCVFRFKAVADRDALQQENGRHKAGICNQGC